MVQVHGIVGACVLSVPTLGYGTVIRRAALGGPGVYTFEGAGSLTLCVDDVCTTLGVAPCLCRWS